MRIQVNAALREHPRGLVYLALTEGFDRLAFFGTQTILVLYMVDQLLLPGHVETVAGFTPFRAALEDLFGPLSPQGLASRIFGLFGGLAYITPPLGGLIGDRLLGQRRCILAAIFVMVAGYFMMAFEVSFLAALLCLAGGSGLLKGNISTQVGGLYRPRDRRRADGFIIFNLGDAVGGIFASLVCGTLGEVYGWRYGFIAAAVALTVGGAIYLSGLSHYPPDRVGPGKAKGRNPRLAAGDWTVLAALMAVLAVVTSYLTAVNELGNVYPIWVQAYVDRAAFGAQVPITWFFSFSAIVTVATSFLLFRLWRWQARRGREPSMLGKIGIGCAICSAAFAVLAALSVAAQTGARIGWVWLLLFHCIFAIGYLFVWPVGLALFSRAAPPQITATVMGLFFFSEFLSNILVGHLGGFYERMPPDQFWLMHAAIPAVGAAFIAAFRRPLGRILVERAASDPLTVH